ncbi:hypothetical protein N7463_010454 [Penicillium fimorum]|uniref:Uncharacterized protein n=1 Tax=Penicillium fimorum TaxID=1882269 RepID=A0A9W9XJW6_9EURO|nr:hypothetical protein N7463_010454 [Penicillium fimorum]
MADDDQWTISTYIVSTLIGLSIGGFIIFLLMVICLVVKNLRRQRGARADTGADDKRNLLENQRNTLPTFANIPAIPTVTTIPGHAISDMDRDIKFQFANLQELQKLDAAIYWNHAG